MKPIATSIAVVLLLVGCSAKNGDQPGTVTADELRQLNDAAAMLDANSVDINAAAANDQDNQ